MYLIDAEKFKELKSDSNKLWGKIVNEKCSHSNYLKGTFSEWIRPYDEAREEYYKELFKNKELLAGYCLVSLSEIEEKHWYMVRPYLDPEGKVPSEGEGFEKWQEWYNTVWDEFEKVAAQILVNKSVPIPVFMFVSDPEKQEEIQKNLECVRYL